MSFLQSPSLFYTASESTFGALPLLVRRRYKWPFGIAFTLLNAFLYMAANHFHLFEPQLLRMTWVDQVVPFIPHTVWVYITEYVLFLAVYWLCDEEENLNRYAYAFLAQQLFAVTIFTAWPTTYPRELFPLPSDLDSLTYGVFSSLREADTPASCCPSLHVSSVYLSALMLLHEKKSKFPFFFAWATLIALSTLTTKQHYLVDVIAGFAVALFFFWLFSARFTYQTGKRKDERLLT